MNSVVAVVVTYNRLSLLQEAIEALKIQTIPVRKIVIVNNGSTDGTKEWLAIQQSLTVINQENTGGSGGFYTGIKHSAKLGHSWIWVMDDDTICAATALEKLLEKQPLFSDKKVGFICSKVVWRDGLPHNMNLPDVKLLFNKKVPFTTYDHHKVLLAEGCSFVSVLLSTDVVKEVGLPYKDFYIWGDDQEYTRRITQAGYLGIYCSDSVVLHKTANNHRAYIYTDNPKNLWKHAYGFRNEFFMVRKNKGLIYYLLYVAARVTYGTFKIIKTRKTDRWEFIKVLFSSAWKSFFFNPEIEML
jgi:rhamnopyranosyl-N-acetylglucosaminyl-diphospho-decaprenol beta-1,3/1,4-galactofuranosyltransferase